jgi:hypothetical protein
MKDLVDVRPSFGLVPAQALLTLNIKYSGLPEQLEKAKLLINWVSI